MLKIILFSFLFAAFLGFVIFLSDIRNAKEVDQKKKHFLHDDAILKDME